MLHAINWFEIPVLDFDRARTFYEAILNAKMEPMQAMNTKSAFFPAELDKGAIGGCITQGPGYIPSDQGSLVYMNGGKDLNDVLSKVEAAGGKIMLPKMSIGDNGFMAQFIDTEGNKIGLHSQG